MNEVISSINTSDLQNSTISTEDSQFFEINRLQSRILSLYAAIRFSTNAYYDGDHGRALKYLDKVEDMFNNLRQNHALGVIYNNKAGIFKANLQLGEAITAYNKSIRIAREFLWREAALREAPSRL